MRLPAWIQDRDDPEPFRPWGAVWVSLSTGRMTIETEKARDSHGPELLVEALFKFAQQERHVLGGRASRLHVTDGAAREAIEQAIDDAGTSVELVPRADAVDKVIRAYEAHVVGKLLPSALDGPGVRVELLREFAEAAAHFYTAAPWQHLTNDDLIQIQSDVPQPFYQFAVVLGNAGQMFGIGFYATPEDYYSVAMAGDSRRAAAKLRETCSVLFDAADGIPFDDHDLWTDHGLPLAGSRAYPFAARYYDGGKRISRPGRDELAFLAGLLRALAETSEDEMDTGRWAKKVQVSGRRTTVRLALPDVLAPSVPRLLIHPDHSRRASERIHAEIGRFMESREFADLDEANRAIAEHFGSRPIDEVPSTASTPLERAQELCYEAYDSVGRRRMALAKQALALSADCAEACVILAEQASTPERALDCYEQGISAGRRAIGNKYDDLVGEFWGHVATRPYMRARMGRAQTLELMEHPDEAIAEYQDLLRLNPGDNQGARYLLVALLLERGRDDEAGRVFEAYPDDVAATFHYARLLWLFRRDRDAPEARAAFAKAMKINPHAPGRLLEWKQDEVSGIGHFHLGSEDEAMVCADEIGRAWERTPGALEWLREQIRLRRKAKPAVRRAGQHGRKRRR